MKSKQKSLSVLTVFIVITALFLISFPVSAASDSATEYVPIASFPVDGEVSAMGTMELAPGSGEVQLTFETDKEMSPRVDDKYITWIQYCGDSKVWYYDIAADTRNQVSVSSGNQRSPDILNGIIVWSENRKLNEDIFSYNIAMHKEEALTSTSSYKFNPAISGDYVVFEDFGVNDYKGIAYTRLGSTAAPVFIEENSKEKANPDISGNWVVYQQLDGGVDDWNIYLYNIATKTSLQVTRDPHCQQNPRIDGDLVVWEDSRNGKWDVFIYDIKKDTVNAVTYDALDNMEPAVSGSIVVFTRYQQDGKAKVYMVNLQIPRTYKLSDGPGNQNNPDIFGDNVVWEDDRFGGEDVYYFKLDGDTAFKPYQFYGTVTINNVNAPIGTEILAKVDGIVRSSITTTIDGYYGGKGETSGQLKVDITQSDIGKYISFWSNGVQGTPSIKIEGSGKMMEQPINFGSSPSLTDLALFGSVTIDGQPAQKGQQITAKIDDIARGSYQLTQNGYYGGEKSGDPALTIQITEGDLGKHVTFWYGDYKAAETFQITCGGRFCEDLSFVTTPPVSNPYEFYGYALIDGNAAPAGTKIVAKLGDAVATSYTMKYSGSYGGPGVNPEDPRLIVKVGEADVGKTITFFVNDQKASASQVVARNDERIFRKDLDFSNTPSGISADFMGSPLSGEAPLTVQFTDLSTGNPTMWAWDFGDGVTPMSANADVDCSSGNCGENWIANPTHTYSKPGTYTVTLTASNQNGGADTEIKQGYVTVGSTPSGIVADFVGYPTSGSAPLTVQFTDLSTGNPSIWHWDFGDGVTPMSDDEDSEVDCSSGNCGEFRNKNPTHTYSSVGTYTVTLTASNRNGDKDTETKQGYITVGNTPAGIIADFTGYPTSGQAPLTVEFTDHSTGTPTMWYWDFGDGTMPVATCSGSGCDSNTVANPTHTYREAGTYTVTLTASNQYGDVGKKEKENYITVSSIPSGIDADFVGNPSSGDAPLTVKFTDLSAGNPSRWNWDFGDGIIPMSDNESVEDSANNSEVECSSGNCNENRNKNPVHTYRDAGVYTVTLTASDNYGNSDTEKKDNYIYVGYTPAPTPTMTPSPVSDSIPIYQGWNFISVPKKLASGYDTAQIFDKINVDGHTIFQFDATNGQWLRMSPSSPVKPMDAIWIYSTRGDSVPVVYSTDPLSTPPTKELVKGWNAVGFTGLSALETKFSFLSVQDKWVNCLGYDAIGQKYDQMIIKGYNDDNLMYPYNGYWVFMSEKGILAGISV